MHERMLTASISRNGRSGANGPADVGFLIPRNGVEKLWRPRDHWNWRTLEDAYQATGRRSFVVKGLLPLSSLTILFGAPGALKTMLMLDLALCVAGGQCWLGPPPGEDTNIGYPCVQQPVLWLDVDNGEERIGSRLKIIGQTHGIAGDSPFSFTSFPQPPFAAQDRRSVENVIGKAKSTSARLIVFDNLGTVSGGADENSSKMIDVMAGLRTIADVSSAAVVVIHHSTKAKAQRAGNNLRGHSSIEGAIDLALFLERKHESNVVTVTSTKTRDMPVEPFSAQWTHDEADGELVRGQFYGLGPAVGGSQQSAIDNAYNALLELDIDGKNQTEIVRLVKGSCKAGRNATLEALAKHVEEGRFREEGGSRNSKIYYKA